MRRRPSIKVMTTAIKYLKLALMSRQGTVRYANDPLKIALEWIEHEREMQKIQNKGKQVRHERESYTKPR